MKALKVIGIIVGVIILIAVSIGTYIKVALPNTGKAEDISIEATPERLERGKYLAYSVAVCMDCHSTRDWSRFAGPMTNTDIGGGGEPFNQDMGFPGIFSAKNITPFALKNWTDGEILRAITTGVNKDGKALFPVMSYHRFGKMDKEDIYSIIAFIRTLEPVEKPNIESKADFPVNFLINTMPQKADFQTKPAETDLLAYGGYVINAAGCVDCHSQVDKGKVVKGTEFGGGMAFSLPSGILRTPNITADEETGIGSWNKEAFVNRFKAFADSAYVAPIVEKGSWNTPMPWSMYAGMKTSDLEAIYAYLRSVTPIKHAVTRFTPRQ